MKQAKNLKPGSIVQFPVSQFAPLRSGWNGWIFRAAIVNRLYTSKSGEKCAEITYCTRTAGRYQNLPNVEKTIKVKQKYLFDYSTRVNMLRRFHEENPEDGETVCADQDLALLLNHNLI